jgi:hypothetical protein
MSAALLIFLFVIATSIWGYIEARQLYPAGQAIAWGFGFVLLWPVFFPIFLLSRSRRLHELTLEQLHVPNSQMAPPPPPAPPSQTSAAPSERPPGWYDDPWRQATSRWWDGFHWSDQIR